MPKRCSLASNLLMLRFLFILSIQSMFVSRFLLNCRSVCDNRRISWHLARLEQAEFSSVYSGQEGGGLLSSVGT